MSKFDELCKAYADSRKEFFEYENECRRFGAKLVTGLIAYLGCPEKQIKYYPIGKEPDPNKEYFIGGAMKFNEVDKFWHIGIGITVYEAPNIHPKEL